MQQSCVFQGIFYGCDLWVMMRTLAEIVLAIRSIYEKLKFIHTG